MNTSFRSTYGPFALVTGAAHGLGAEFARQLAERGLDLVLLDVLRDPLEALGADLARRYAVEVRCLPLDLARPDLADAVEEACQELAIGLLVSSAALAPIGSFFAQDLPQKLEALAVNCRAPLALVDVVGRQMIHRGRGGILLVSSLSARTGAPLAAAYAATKAFNLLLAESLFLELRGHGIDVLALCPGVTDTWGFRLSTPDRASLAGRSAMDPAVVVEGALASLSEGPAQISGLRNRLAGLLLSLLPRRAALALVDASMRGLYPER